MLPNNFISLIKFYHFIFASVLRLTKHNWIFFFNKFKDRLSNDDKQNRGSEGTLKEADMDEYIFTIIEVSNGHCYPPSSTLVSILKINNNNI